MTITVDTRGTGTSRDAADGFTIEQFAADALVVLDDLGIEEAHVVGWSMGTAVAMTLALLAPYRVRSLSLYTPWARTDAGLKDRFLAMREKAEFGDDLVDVEEYTLGLILSPDALAAIPDRRAAASEATQQPGFPSREALIGHLDASIQHDVLDRLGSVRCPTLVVAGERDALTPAYLAQQVADAIPGSEYEEMTGPLSSHALPLELSGPFSIIARSFLDRH